jgi:hypothetical protein
LHLGPQHFLRWTHELHHFKGNLLLADGHVDEVNSLTLMSAGDSQRMADLVIPSVVSAGVTGGGGGGGSGGGAGGRTITGDGAAVGPSSSEAANAGNAPRPGPGVQKPGLGNQAPQVMAQGLVVTSQNPRQTTGGKPTGDQKSEDKVREKDAVAVTNVIVKTEVTTNAPAVQWPVALAQARHPFSSWPLWVLLFILLAIILYMDLRRRLEVRRRLLERERFHESRTQE